jgi:hypothetical protein
LALGCGSQSDDSAISSDEPAGVGGGTVGSGGSASTGGRVGSGGTVGTGGALGGGGSTGTGGNTGRGGAVGSGGTVGTGGALGGGGTVGSGGAATGGSTGTGGALATGCASGTPGQWENFGANGLVSDPRQPNVFYTSVCFQGVWKSTDCGKGWQKVSTGTLGSKLDAGKPWALAIAPDGSYMLTCVGNGENGIYKSTDGGVNWTYRNVPYPGTDVYTIAISPYDKNHAVTTSHTFDAGHVWESIDAGETWVDSGPMGTGGASGYLDFLFDDGTLLLTNDGDNGNWGGTLRGVRSGSAWPWTWTWTWVNKQQHFHGSHQAFVDTVNHAVFNPGGFGIFRSVDEGLTWDTVSSNLSNTMIGTATTLYATSSYASGSYGSDPRPQHAARAPGTSWTSDPTPNGMTNGAARFATASDGSHHVVVSANWLAGLWRYVEP